MWVFDFVRLVSMHTSDEKAVMIQFECVYIYIRLTLLFYGAKKIPFQHAIFVCVGN